VPKVHVHRLTSSTNLACNYERLTGVGSSAPAEGAAFHVIASPRIRLRYVDYVDN